MCMLVFVPLAVWRVLTNSIAAAVVCFEDIWSLCNTTCLREGATIDVAMATTCSASLWSSPADRKHEI